MSTTLFSELQTGALTLPNRIVMAPMTRSRAIHNLANPSIATYYAQRASAGLIISEGISPSPNGLGYARIPGLFSTEQVESWKPVTQAVHEKGGKIFAQFMHTGRVSHPLNMPVGARVLAPSAVPANGQMWTDQQGMQPNATPEAMTLEEVKATIGEFVQAAKNAVAAGFDGIELHGANGYLIEQFLNPHTNQRTDEYGGSFENRSRFLLETAQLVANAIGREKVGVRISPFGVFNDMPPYDEVEATYEYLAEKLNGLGIVYLHVLEAANSAPLMQKIRARFRNTLMLNYAYDAERAEAVLKSGLADLISFGRPFVANPDLVERFKAGAELAVPDPATLYSGDDKGFIDYPVLSLQSAVN